MFRLTDMRCPKPGQRNARPFAEAAAVNIVPVQELDPVQVAQAVAQAAGSLEALQQALGDFELCDLKKGARSLVFGDGVAGARVMIIGEAPDRDEDREGRPFVGRAGRFA